MDRQAQNPEATYTTYFFTQYRWHKHAHRHTHKTRAACRLGRFNLTAHQVRGAQFQPWIVSCPSDGLSHMATPRTVPVLLGFEKEEQHQDRLTNGSAGRCQTSLPGSSRHHRHQSRAVPLEAPSTHINYSLALALSVPRLAVTRRVGGLGGAPRLLSTLDSMLQWVRGWIRGYGMGCWRLGTFGERLIIGGQPPGVGEGAGKGLLPTVASMRPGRCRQLLAGPWQGQGLHYNSTLQARLGTAKLPCLGRNCLKWAGWQVLRTAAVAVAVAARLNDRCHRIAP
jgi:hypothetical protein